MHAFGHVQVRFRASYSCTNKSDLANMSCELLCLYETMRHLDYDLFNMLGRMVSGVGKML